MFGLATFIFGLAELMIRFEIINFHPYILHVLTGLIIIKITPLMWSDYREYCKIQNLKKWKKYQNRNENLS